MAGQRGEREREPLLGGVLAIVSVGLVLGVVFNWLGRGGHPAWGLPWIAEDKVAALESLEVAGGSSDGNENPYAEMNDPMGIPAVEGLPQIPDLDRPIQIELGAVKQLVDADAAVVVDAREAGEYALGHIPGALSMPYDEVSSEPERLETLDTGGKPIVVYCGGGTCELSLNMAWDLIYAGQKRVVVFMGGFPDWEAAGYPVDRGDS